MVVQRDERIAARAQPDAFNRVVVGRDRGNAALRDPVEKFAVGSIERGTHVVNALAVDLPVHCQELARESGVNAEDVARSHVDAIALEHLSQRVVADVATKGDGTRIVVTGSHGGLLRGNPQSALKIGARAAFFNDAGVGCDGAGISRLPELDRREIVAGTVSHWTARIGDARSSWETGVLSHVNRSAERVGAKPGMRLRELVEMIAR